MTNEYFGVPSTPTSDYLAHYGVLGMKWGIRRAAKKGIDYSYKSHATKKYERLAEKLAAKGKTDKAKKMANRAKRSREIDKGEEEFARGIKTRDAVGLSLLTGGNTMKGYMQNRAMEKQKGKQLTGKKMTAAVLAGWTGSTGSRLRKAAYIRQDENRKGLGESIRKFDKGMRDRVSEGNDVIANIYNKKKKRR